jgi:hypothetical protein
VDAGTQALILVKRDTVNKMIATQHAYPPESPVSQMDVEIKSQFHESTVDVPELEILHVRDITTVSRLIFANVE